jgi:signal transduction histidine kinase
MKKILVVDDNEQNLYMLQVLLSADGYTVEQASNGAEALEMARRAPPGLVISDILMPVMDGFSLCRAWKSDERLKDIPFVFYTATYTDPKDEDFALSLGAERFIIKPSEPASFLETLRQVLATHQAVQLQPARQPVDDAGYYRAYNATLIRKLEEKVMQLEEAKRALEADIARRRQVEASLQQLNAELEQRVEARTHQLQSAQERLVQQERLATLGRLARGVSHELRNPLGVISNAVYYLKIILPGEDAKVREYLEILERESQAAAQLIAHLLNYANIQPGERQPVAPLELVNQALARHPAPASITVLVDLAPDLPQVFVAPDQIEQALGHLLVNAHQAMPGGGSLSLRGRRAAPGDQPGVWLEVQDTGPGIPPEHMPSIFEPLFSTKPRGLGLGLALSQKLAQANGGDLQAHSQPGQGALFSLFLPIR